LTRDLETHGPDAEQEPATRSFTTSAANLQKFGRAAGAGLIVIVSTIGGRPRNEPNLGPKDTKYRRRMEKRRCSRWRSELLVAEKEATRALDVLAAPTAPPDGHHPCRDKGCSVTMLDKNTR
jgi:hypothetical protein